MDNEVQIAVNDNNSNINSVVVIPALNPTSSLPNFVEKLFSYGVPHVIVVNDGSDDSYDNIFEQLKSLKNCTLLAHETNLGKGKALKTAFSYFTENFSDFDGIVTADADGQHSVEDICKICKKLNLRQDCLILGVRNFNEGNVPKKSYMGNIITSRLFQILFGTYLSDTQTGLRGIPANELPWILQLKGDRYEFEINMLIRAKYRNLSFLTVPIETIYFNNNSASHYKPIKDSLRIFTCLISGLVKYSLATTVSGFIDVLCFFILNTIIFAAITASLRIFLSTVIARITSSIFNYMVNRNYIFTDSGDLKTSMIRYYMLCIFIMMSSYIMVYSISLFWKVNESIIKIFVDIMLGFVSYQTQLHLIFRNKTVSCASLMPSFASYFNFKNYLRSEK